MRRLGLACAALIMLSACSGEPTPIEPKAKASESSTAPSAGATSTLKPPTLPAAAKRNDETGAANFVNYWVKVFELRVHNRRHLTLLRSISAPECVPVAIGYVDLYEKTYEAGGYFRRRDRRLERVEVQTDRVGDRCSSRLLARTWSLRNVGDLPEKSLRPSGYDDDADYAWRRWNGGRFEMASCLTCGPRSASTKLHCASCPA